MTDFSKLCLLRGDRSRSGSLNEQAEKLRQAIEDSAWDGKWYRRAYFDNQLALGSAQNRECQIDLIAQAWAVLSGAGDPSRSSMAMQSAIERLVREEERLILLLTPPFNKTHWDPGYIQAYPPGVRENGGQYTHGAIWGVLALAQQGDGDRAESLFRLLNPILRTARRTDLERYRVEPYVMAADVYGESPHVGKGGWTWYTGSSAWMYRLGLEALLGLRIRKNKIQIDPCIPRNWEEYRINLRHGTSQYRITIDNPEQVNRGVLEISADGVPVASNEIPLYEDGKRHEIRVRMGQEEQRSRAVGPSSDSMNGCRSCRPN
jgi:cyclic beta-1,2-glucan synthetase